jgi:glycosyltransferase involved in cell wall biosynthesis
MRILYFADIRFPLERANGIQTMETCYALAERGHDVRLVVKGDTHVPPRDPFEFYGLAPLRREGRLVVERANAPAGAGTVARVGYMSFALGRAYGHTRADILMTRDLGVAALLLHLPPSLRAPLVYESHGYAPDVARALPGMLATARPPSASKIRRLTAREDKVWKNVQGYVAITHGIIEHMESRAGSRAHAAVIPDGVRVAKGASALPSEPVVGYAGHLYAWKGVDVLLRAAVNVPAARLLIVGGHEQEPDLARLQNLASELGIAERVTFTGLVEPARVAGLLARAQVLVLPNPASAISTHFTSPLKLFEYMAAGRAIVASDLPAIREVLHEGQTALLVEPGRPEAFAAAITRLLGDRALAERLARNAAAEAVSYTWARRAQRLEALFTEVRAA